MLISTVAKGIRWVWSYFKLEPHLHVLKTTSGVYFAFHVCGLILIDLMALKSAYRANGDLTEKKRMRLKRLIDWPVKWLFMALSETMTRGAKPGCARTSFHARIPPAAMHCVN